MSAPLILFDCYPWQAGGCEWSIGYLWHSWDLFGRSAIVLLALMAAHTLVIGCRRFYRYRTANTQSRAFLRDADTLLREGRFDELTAIAARNTRSPVAAVFVEGIRAFASVPPKFTDREAIDAVERAIRRAIALLVADLGLGLGTLRTIASSAPFIGLAGTCFGILNAFQGIGMEKSSAIAMIASYIAEALLMTAVGLFVAVPAVWLHNCLWRRVEVLKSGMLKAEAQTLAALNAHVEWRFQRVPLVANTNRGFLMANSSWEVSYDRQRALFVAMWVCGLYLALAVSLRAC